MFMKQATTDRLLGMLVTLATGAAILYIQVSDDCQGWAQHAKMCMCLGMHGLTHLYHTHTKQHRIKVFVNRRKASGKGERPETKKVRPAAAKVTYTAQGSGTLTPLSCCCLG